MVLFLFLSIFYSLQLNFFFFFIQMKEFYRIWAPMKSGKTRLVICRIFAINLYIYPYFIHILFFFVFVFCFVELWLWLLNEQITFHHRELSELKQFTSGDKVWSLPLPVASITFKDQWEWEWVEWLEWLKGDSNNFHLSGFPGWKTKLERTPHQ